MNLTTRGRCDIEQASRRRLDMKRRSIKAGRSWTPPKALPAPVLRHNTRFTGGSEWDLGLVQDPGLVHELQIPRRAMVD